MFNKSSVFALLISLFCLSAYAQTPCPAGQHMDASMHMCMPDATPAPTPSCPADQFWDTSMTPAMCMPSAAPTTFKGLQRNVFSNSCVSCHANHGPTDPAEAGIDFTSFESTMLSNQNSSNPRHAPFIIAGNPEQSKLYLSLKSGKMPATEDGSPGPGLRSELIQNVYDWIKAGAINN